MNAQEKLVVGVVVIEVDSHLSSEQREQLSHYTQKAWPDNTVVILEKGMRVGTTPEHLAQLENKIDLILGILTND